MFKEISHTADMGLYVESTTYQGLFYDASLGLMVISGIETLDDNKIYIEKYEDKSIDKETLLINWLNFLIFKLEKNYYLINCIIKIYLNSIKSTCYLKKLAKRNKYIKSATFHNLQIIKSNNIIKTTVIFDV